MLCLFGPVSVLADTQTAAGLTGSESNADTIVAAKSAEKEDAAPDGSEAPLEEGAPKVERESWDIRVDQFEQDALSFAEVREDPNALFEELTALIQMRARQFDLMVSSAASRNDPADDHIDVLAAVFPDLPADLIALPDYVVSIQDAHENLLGLYQQRIRLLAYVSDDFRAQITGLELYGMQQLYSELGMIWLELRYQVLRVPDAGRLVMQMAVRAPLPLVWFVLELGLLIFIFSWWRRWFPETITRMRNYLLSIRPRSVEIVRRMRGLWYVERIRKPVEWLLFFIVLISLTDFLQLEFVTDIGLIVIRWIFISWFIVALLDAVIARGAGGAASETGKTRRRSFRLLAAWLVMLGLGLELTDRLAGPAALYTNIWRLFQVLFFPVVFIQLGMWREELFRRARFEDKEFMSRAEYEAQTGLGKYVGATKLIGFLFAARLRRHLLRRLERYDPGRSASLDGAVGRAPTESNEEGLDEETRSRFLSGSMNYTRYARAERNAVIERIEGRSGGDVIVIGERGIGKDGFLELVCQDADPEYISIDCAEGTARSIERQLSAQLGIEGPFTDREAIAAAITEKQIDVVAVNSVHMMVRPVMEGFAELEKASQLFGLLPGHVARVMTMDRYAWQYIRCALPEVAASAAQLVQLPAWSDEQIMELISGRCKEVGIEPDLLQVRVPSQYLNSGDDSIRERNRKGICAMISTLSGGNPSIALRLFTDCLYKGKSNRWIVGLPKNLSSHSVAQSSLHVLLVLRVIAQAERINKEDIVANLRYSPAVVENALRVALGRGWVREKNGRYSLAWPWFRTITRVLARQNLLAGVRQVVE